MKEGLKTHEEVQDETEVERVKDKGMKRGKKSSVEKQTDVSRTILGVRENTREYRYGKTRVVYNFEGYDSA